MTESTEHQSAQTAKPVAWLCEFFREDDTVDTQVVLQDPEGTRWADMPDGDGVSPFRVTPLYTRATRGGAAVPQGITPIDAMCEILKQSYIESDEYTDCAILYRVTFDQLRAIYDKGRSVAATPELSPPPQGGDARPTNAVLVPADKLAHMQQATKRYEWLRAGNYPIDLARSILNDTPCGIDEAIDTAITAKEKTK